MDGAYYPCSSVLFYANSTALLLNGCITNLEYGSYAPGAPPVFIKEGDFARLWEGQGHARCYLRDGEPCLADRGRLAGPANLHLVMASGGKLLVTNTATAASAAGNSSGKAN